MSDSLTSVPLPLTCSVTYYKNFVQQFAARSLYQQILQEYHIHEAKLSWKAEGEVMESDFGKIIFTDQELLDQNTFETSVWGVSYCWPTTLFAIKKEIEELTQTEFRVCVCIYYPDGNSGVDFHSDYVAFGDTNLIPSLSLGEERIFQLRENLTQKIFSQLLHEGSLILMGDQCQELYEHALPTDPKYKSGRINLTFRQYGL